MFKKKVLVIGYDRNTLVAHLIPPGTIIQPLKDGNASLKIRPFLIEYEIILIGYLRCNEDYYKDSQMVLVLHYDYFDEMWPRDDDSGSTDNNFTEITKFASFHLLNKQLNYLQGINPDIEVIHILGGSFNNKLHELREILK